MTDHYDFNFHSPFLEPLGKAILKQNPEDFMVDEVLGFSPEGSGEHLYVHIEKTSQNTQWIAKQLAKSFHVKERDVGYCGLKDRHAVTTQWFSVYLPKPPQDIPATLAAFAQQQQCSVVQFAFSQKKLRRGAHTGNQFKITLHGCSADETALAQRVHQIAESGVPNYFGLQRFGRGGNNLVMADQMWKEGVRIGVKSQKQMAISAARSYLFNTVLDARVQQDNWRINIDGDVLDAVAKPTGPLWGRGRLATTGEANSLETASLEPFAAWCDGLEHCGLNQERRSLVCQPQALSLTADGDSVILEFFLPPGQYATTVIDALVETQEPDRT